MKLIKTVVVTINKKPKEIPTNGCLVLLKNRSSAAEIFVKEYGENYEAASCTEDNGMIIESGEKVNIPLRINKISAIATEDNVSLEITYLGEE